MIGAPLCWHSPPTLRAGSRASSRAGPPRHPRTTDACSGAQRARWAGAAAQLQATALGAAAVAERASVAQRRPTAAVRRVRSPMTPGPPPAPSCAHASWRGSGRVLLAQEPGHRRPRRCRPGSSRSTVRPPPAGASQAAGGRWSARSLLCGTRPAGPGTGRPSCSRRSGGDWEYRSPCRRREQSSPARRAHRPARAICVVFRSSATRVSTRPAGKKRCEHTSSSATQAVETAFANVHMLFFVNSMRSSSRS